jgi:hypothetical protein
LQITNRNHFEQPLEPTRQLSQQPGCLGDDWPAREYRAADFLGLFPTASVMLIRRLQDRNQRTRVD